MTFFEDLPVSTRQLIILWGPGLLELLGKLVYAFLIFMVGRWLSARLENVVRALLLKARVESALSDFLSALVRYAVIAAAVIAALEKLDVKTASLLAVFASAGLAVGLALQGSLSNFAAGTMILFFRPFTKGDQVEIAGKTGIVDEIGIFTTRLVSRENETIIIPNSSVTGGTIINFSARGSRLGEVVVELKADEDSRSLAVRLEDIATKNSLQAPDTRAQVYWKDLNKLAVRIQAPAHQYEEALSELRSQIHRLLTHPGDIHI
jgi:small conductance mechanosensitive channel